MLLLSLGCATSKNEQTKPIRLTSNESETRERILAEIAVGMPIHAAEEAMTASGFSCTAKDDEDGEYLYCDAQQSESTFIKRRWQVKVRHRDGRVSDVEVRTGLIGM
ncbi:MAG: hypothetical protein DWQ45_13345 [Planctomycetota bacterium]|nr:MAG: hypothetical protein DWQ45_13345 [Planctomycetota bacterium]